MAQTSINKVSFHEERKLPTEDFAILDSQNQFLIYKTTNDFEALRP